MFKNYTFLKRLISFSMVIGTLPVVLLGIFSYLHSSQVIQDKLNKVNMQVLHQAQMRVEQILRLVNNHYVFLADNLYVEDMLYNNPSVEEYKQLSELQKNLNGLRNIQIAVTDASLFSMNTGLRIGAYDIAKITPGEEKEIKEALEKMGNLKSSFWTQSISSQSAYSGVNGTDPGSTASATESVKLFIKVPLNSIKPAGAIVVSLSSKEINKISLPDRFSGEIFILDSNYKILSHENSTRIGKDISEEPYIAYLVNHGEMSGNYTAQIEGREEVGVNFIRSSYNGWIYVSIMSISEITRESNAIGWLTLLICIFITVCTVVVSFLGSKKIYLPVRDLYEMVKKNLKLDRSEKKTDEFLLIGEGFDTLLRSQFQMAKQIQGQAGQLEEFFVSKLVENEVSDAEVGARLDMFGYSGCWKRYCVICIQIDSLEGSQFKEHDRDLMMFAVNNIACELIAPEARLAPVLKKQVQIVVLGWKDENEEGFSGFVLTLAEELQKVVREYLGFGVSIGISRIFTQLADAPIAYKESTEALKYRIRLGMESILRFEDVQPGNSISQPYPLHLEEELVDAIKGGDTGKVDSLLERMVSEILKEKVSFFEYQMSFMRLLTSITRIHPVQWNPVQHKLISNKNMFEQLQEIKNAEEAKNWFRYKVIQPVMTRLEENRRSQYRQITEQILQIIRQEYDNELTIEICAGRLNYSSHYLWRVLKKELGMSFSEYLLQYRLDISKKWLQETDMTVTEIAERLKYNNVQNYIRYFKKLEGVTPGQYREMNRGLLQQ